ncbi:MAG TPA: hydrogenase formation protein HypD [Polyangia bacterium]|nr:hydrogenase formation protein HypD [Polyangia bacterium]
MRYIDGFRDGAAARALVARISEAGERLRSMGRTARLMEVCGTHTMSIARHGIGRALPAGVELLSGPGCPVCVTDTGYVDTAIELARRGAIVCTFGDMLRVPGSTGSLDLARAEGAEIRICYSPAEAAAIARAEPERQVVFLAIGFETTVAPVVSLVGTARREGLRNLSLLTAFKTVPPALAALLDDPEVAIDALICPPHVSAIIGADAYRPLVERYGVPCVVAGFEPLDILYAITELLGQIAASTARLSNQYERVVRPAGNRRARELMERYLEPVDAVWRGIGVIRGSGLALRPDYADFDAVLRHGVSIGEGRPDPGCRCGDVLKGKIAPTGCPLFGAACTPAEPVGPCMVSSEGSCAAHYRYSR